MAHTSTRRASCLAVLAILFAPSLARTQDTPVERLAELGKLWGTIQYFHPFLAYRPLDWESALVAAIPRVKRATNRAEYADAVQSMLDALDDPVTRVVAQRTDSPMQTTPASLVRRLDGDIVVFDFRNYETVLSTWALKATIREEISTAQAVLFDLRPLSPTSPDNRFHLTFYMGLFSDLFSTEPLWMPQTRSRIHKGFAPEPSGVTSGEYTSGFHVTDPWPLEPSSDAVDVPTVFLVNEASGLPLQAVALQMAGKAAIVAHGGIPEDAVVATHRMRLTDDVEVQVRLGELIHDDGTGGWTPDLVAPASSPDDRAFEEALSLVRRFDRAPRLTRAFPPRGPPSIDRGDDDPYPGSERRLLAAFKMWSVIHFFFPYKDLMEDDWDEVLLEFIPRMEDAADALAYHLAVAEMYSHTRDSHGDVRSAVLRDYFGVTPTPIYARWIEERPVVAGFFDADAAPAEVEIGDVIVAVDGEPAVERMRRIGRYVSASTPQALTERTVRWMLRGAEDSTASIEFEKADGRRVTVKLTRRAAYWEDFTYRGGEVVDVLPGNIGYADLERLTIDMVPEMFARLQETRAIVFDMRGYPRGTGPVIATYLAAKPEVEAARMDIPLLVSPDEEGRQTYTIVQRIPAPSPEAFHYPGETVMLIDERAISQSERWGLLFRAANGTTFIGSHTAGAEGAITNFALPGGIALWFGGLAGTYHDGGRVQGLGLVPDIEARPTVLGIREGRDEVLEAALDHLNRR